jgi:hypothetical protein
VEKAISREWTKLKSDLTEKLKETIEKGNSDNATLEMMLSMLENSKLKNRRKKK